MGIIKAIFQFCHKSYTGEAGKEALSFLANWRLRLFVAILYSAPPTFYYVSIPV